MRYCLLVFSVLSVMLSAGPVTAQKSLSPIARRAVDRITLKSGLALHGAILGRDAQGTVSIVVQREWLKSASLRYYKQRTAGEGDEAEKALTTLRERIQVWLRERFEEKRLVKYLNVELELIDEEVARDKANPQKSESQFLTLTIPAKEIRKGYFQPARNRQVALAAWQFRLKDVESRSAVELFKELKDQGIDPTTLAIDLSDRFPARSETEEQWAARKAILESHFGNCLEFQGTGSFLVPAGSDAKQPDLAALLPQILSQELSKQLEDLLGSAGGTKAKTGDPFAKATKAADEKNVPAVLVTRLDQSLAQKRVSVEKTFLAKMPDGRWKTVWKETTTVDASKARPAAEDDLARHQQIRQIVEAFKTLGLAGGEDQIQTAIRFGAATADALHKSEDGYLAFEKRYTRRLNGPPLVFSRAE